MKHACCYGGDIRVLVESALPVGSSVCGSSRNKLPRGYASAPASLISPLFPRQGGVLRKPSSLSGEVARGFCIIVDIIIIVIIVVVSVNLKCCWRHFLHEPRTPFSICKSALQCIYSGKQALCGLNMDVNVFRPGEWSGRARFAYHCPSYFFLRGWSAAASVLFSIWRPGLADGLIQGMNK